MVAISWAVIEFAVVAACGFQLLVGTYVGSLGKTRASWRYLGTGAYLVCRGTGMNGTYLAAKVNS